MPEEEEEEGEDEEDTESIGHASVASGSSTKATEKSKSKSKGKGQGKSSKSSDVAHEKHKAGAEQDSETLDKVNINDLQAQSIKLKLLGCHNYKCNTNLAQILYQ